MEYPAFVIDESRKATLAFPSDAAAAVEAACAAAEGHEGYEGFLRLLGRKAVQACVYDARHALNRATRAAVARGLAEAGLDRPPGSREPFKFHKSAAMRGLAEKVLMTKIGGTTVGDMTGKVVREKFAEVRAARIGLLVNEELLGWLNDRNIPEDRTVRRAVPAGALLEAWEEINRRHYGPLPEVG